MGEMPPSTEFRMHYMTTQAKGLFKGNKEMHGMCEKQSRNGTTSSNQEFGPREDWPIDFTVMGRLTWNFRYLLVFMDSFTCWLEAFSAGPRRLLRLLNPY